MILRQETGGILLTETKNFHIGDILECGQCFRFERQGDMEYSLIAFGKVLHIRQNALDVRFQYPDALLTIAEFDNIWRPFFDLERDYAAILGKICEKDPVLTAAADFAPGIRLLKQDPWETIISFIISQNNRIPQIKSVIKNISQRFGTQIDDFHHAFPTVDQLFVATETDLRDCKAGFRAGYIMDATRKASAGELPPERDNNLPTEQLRQQLLNVRGIGEKVAHCILLFGYGRYDCFPVDTWVRKVMEQYYFDDEPTKPDVILDFAKQHFGQHAGFAQQYLFHYIRMKNKENANNSK